MNAQTWMNQMKKISSKTKSSLVCFRYILVGSDRLQLIGQSCSWSVYFRLFMATEKAKPEKLETTELIEKSMTGSCLPNKPSFSFNFATRKVSVVWISKHEKKTSQSVVLYQHNRISNSISEQISLFSNNSQVTVSHYHWILITKLCFFFRLLYYI